jgi:hypothetical protein
MASFQYFVKKFQPVFNTNGDLKIIDADQVPKNIKVEFWWTLIDVEETTILAKGFHFANALGYIECQVEWLEGDDEEFEWQDEDQDADL